LGAAAGGPWDTLRRIVGRTRLVGMTMAEALLDTVCAEKVWDFHERAQRLSGANEAWYSA